MEFKVLSFFCTITDVIVLIESDWNLKEAGSDRERRHHPRINRIRLEFKEAWIDNGRGMATIVLIESDWNLKRRRPMNQRTVQKRINRIRLEFKDCNC